MNALAGLRVLNTCSSEDAGELDALLREAGAIPLSFPCVAVTLGSGIAEFDTVLQQQTFDWICLTSQYAVNVFANRVQTIGLDPERLTAPRFATIDPATSTALAGQLGIVAEYTPANFDGKTMARECPIEAGHRVLMPVSNLTPVEAVSLLTGKGAEVTRMVVYQSTIGAGGVDASTLLKDGQLDAITFATASAVDGFVKRLEREEGNLDDTRQVPIACIGPHSRNRAIARGMLRAFCSDDHTLQGILTALHDVTVSRRQEGRYWG